MKTEKITSERTRYSDKCPICGDVIKAFSQSNFEYNMKLHKEKCKKNKKEEKKDER